jgi:radical SAM-linked protein
MCGPDADIPAGASAGLPAAPAKRRRPMPSTPPPPPAVQTLAVRYAKRGPLRFASHRVIQRVFERAVRRARLPIAFSAGFTPHPRLSYLGAAPTGAASEAEYLLVRLTERLAPAAVTARLGAAMPRDLPILDTAEWDAARLGDLAKLLEASRWRFDLGRADSARTAQAVARFLALDRFEAEQTKAGPPGADGPRSSARGGRRSVRPARRIDVRAEVLALRAEAEPGPGSDGPGQPCVILDAVLRHATPAVRPDDVIAALVADGLEIGQTPRVTRLAQGEYAVESGAILDPFSRIGAQASGKDEAYTAHSP